MRSKTIPFALSCLFTALLFGQTSERVLRFDAITAERDIQELITVIRSVSDVQQISRITGQPAVTLRGTAAQAASAEWIARELDNTAEIQGKQEYRIQDSADSVRVFYLKHRNTVQSFNEAATLIRSIGEMRRLFAFNPRKALVLRGTPDQIALGEWLVSKLDLPESEQQGAGASSGNDFQVSAAADDTVRMFYVRKDETLKDLNELATVIRSTGALQRLFVDPSQKAIALRGTKAQLALADWMIRELDNPAGQQSEAKREYRLGGADDYVRVFCATHADTPKRLSEIATQLRTTGQLPQVFTYTPQKVVAVRGTASQIALAEGLLVQFNR